MIEIYWYINWGEGGHNYVGSSLVLRTKGLGGGDRPLNGDDGLMGRNMKWRPDFSGLGGEGDRDVWGVMIVMISV